MRGTPKKRARAIQVHCEKARELRKERLNRNIINTKGEVSLKCFYSNVDQLLNKMEDMRMKIASKEPDLLMLTEVIPQAQRHPVTDTQMKINGYKVYINFEYTDDNLGTSGKGGVAIYVKDNLNCTEIHLETVHGYHVWIELYLHNGDKLLCGCIYRPRTNLKH